MSGCLWKLAKASRRYTCLKNQVMEEKWSWSRVLLDTIFTITRWKLWIFDVVCFVQLLIISRTPRYENLIFEKFDVMALFAWAGSNNDGKSTINNTTMTIKIPFIPGRRRRGWGGRRRWTRRRRTSRRRSKHVTVGRACSVNNQRGRTRCGEYCLCVKSEGFMND